MIRSTKTRQTLAMAAVCAAFVAQPVMADISLGGVSVGLSVGGSSDTHSNSLASASVSVGNAASAGVDVGSNSSSSGSSGSSGSGSVASANVNVGGSSSSGGNSGGGANANVNVGGSSSSAGNSGNGANVNASAGNSSNGGNVARAGLDQSGTIVRRGLSPSDTQAFIGRVIMSTDNTVLGIVQSARLLDDGFVQIEVQINDAIGAPRRLATLRFSPRNTLGDRITFGVTASQFVSSL